MTPRSVSDSLIRDTPILTVDDPADAKGRYAGIFGEREFFAAVFPGYLSELGYAGFVPRAPEDALEKRAACGRDHRVLIIPVVSDRSVIGVITRSDFFHAVAERFLNR